MKSKTQKNQVPERIPSFTSITPIFHHVKWEGKSVGTLHQDILQ